MTGTVPARRASVFTAVPDLVIVLGLYLAARVLTTTLLLLAYAFAEHSPVAHADGPPGFLGFLQSWDGIYYRRIADSGYPSALPTDGAAAGAPIAKNSWAFLPVYPLLARFVMLSGVGFDVAGPLVSLVFGGAATLALFRLLSRHGRTRALWGSALFAFGPMSYVLQLDYAESVFLFFMFAGLAAMIERRYAVLIVVGVLAAFSHPGALALALAVGLQFVRERRPLQLVSAIVIGAAGFAWPVIAAVATGNPNAYFDTELAWWSDYLGRVTFLPLTPWFVFASHYLGGFGVLLVLALLAGFIWFLRRPATTELGHGTVDYTFSYVAYLVAVFLPQQSIFRMLLPLSPLLAHQALTATRSRRTISLAVAVAFQVVGILLFWVIWPP